MTPLQEQTLLNQTQAEINRIALSAFDRLLSNISGGQKPRDAIHNAQGGFVGDYEDALLSAFNQILATSIGKAELRDLNIGGLRLSDKLYQNSRAVESSALEIINDHARGFHDARKLALQLYEGYQLRNEDPLDVRASLPKYFRAAFGDDEAFQRLWDRDYTGSRLKGLADHAGTGPELARLYARINVNNLKTPSLKAAYLQALDAVEQGAGEQRLKTFLKTAYYERNRYLSNRIAQTELHRAYTDRTAVEIMADPKLDYVKIELSVTHPRPDICDLIAEADYYGMGPGVYPKAEAPKPPFHPFCRCVAVPVAWAPDTPKKKPNAERDYLNRLPLDEARQVAGSSEKLLMVKNGAGLDEIINKGVDSMYKLKRLGEFDQSKKRLNDD